MVLYTAYSYFNYPSVYVVYGIYIAFYRHRILGNVAVKILSWHGVKKLPCSDGLFCCALLL